MYIAAFDIGIRNLAVCVLEVLEEGVKIVDWSIIPLVDEKAKIGSLEQITESIFEKLDEFTEKNKKIDVIALENQPVMKNPVMKSVQMVIYSYFMAKKHWMGEHEKVVMVNAGSKIKGHEFELPETDKKGYKFNKWAACEYTKLYLKDTTFLSYFNSNKKKDDLADAFLHAIVWIKRDNSKQSLKIYSSNIDESNY